MSGGITTRTCPQCLQGRVHRALTYAYVEPDEPPEMTMQEMAAARLAALLHPTVTITDRCTAVCGYTEAVGVQT